MPYNDENMIYDNETHSYALTPLAMEKMGILLGQQLNPAGDSNPADLPQRWLKRVSMIVHNRIYSSNSAWLWLEYCLANNSQLRATIQRAMEQQALYMLSVGDLGLQAGVNVEKGTTMDLSYLRGEGRYSPDTLKILENAGLLYQGHIQVPLGINYREGY